MFQFILKLIDEWLFTKPLKLEEILLIHDVATTALLTNYWKDQARSESQWHQLTQKKGSRPKDLYKDPFLAWFYHPAIKTEAENRLNKLMWLPLATRTKYFRKTLSELIKTYQIEQVLILGSGFDTLAVRKKKYPVRYFEIDYAKILACKERIYQTHQQDKNAIYIGMDYSLEDFFPYLIQSGFDTSKKTFILWEGNTFYLKKHIVLHILKTISETLPHLFLSFDFMHPQIAQENTTMESFAKKKSPFQCFFHVDEIVVECQKLQLDVYSHFTAHTLALAYQLDEEPYHTAAPYSVATFSRATT